MQYTKPRSFEENFQHFVDLLKATVPPETKIDQTIAVALEAANSFAFIDFEANYRVQGAIIGLGKEPDVPHDNQKSVLADFGKMHRDTLKMRPEQVFIVSEERILRDRYIVITGAKCATRIWTKPHIETYRFQVKRGKRGQIKTIGNPVKVDTFLDHKSFILSYLDMVGWFI